MAILELFRNYRTSKETIIFELFEKSVFFYFRESSAGINRVSYFLAVNLANIPVLLISPAVYLSIYYSIASFLGECEFLCVQSVRCSASWGREDSRKKEMGGIKWEGRGLYEGGSEGKRGHEEGIRSYDWRRRMRYS